MRGRTITHFLVLGGCTKRGVALNEESALNEVVRYIYMEQRIEIFYFHKSHSSKKPSKLGFYVSNSF